jgi:plastocyanin
MRRTLTTAASLAVAGILLVASGAAGKTKTVEVNDNFFDPGTVKIAKKDKVAFEWVGSEEHNVTKTKGPGKFFESETTDEPGVNFTKRFKKSGKYKLICTLHSNMDVTVRVK